MQLVGSDLPYFSADAPNWCVSLIHRQPRGQNRNQAGRSCNDLEIGAEAFQVIQMKIDTGGYSDGQRASTQSNIRSSPHDCAEKNHTNGPPYPQVAVSNLLHLAARLL